MSSIRRRCSLGIPRSAPNKPPHSCSPNTPLRLIPTTVRFAARIASCQVERDGGYVGWNECVRSPTRLVKVICTGEGGDDFEDSLEENIEVVSRKGVEWQDQTSSSSPRTSGGVLITVEVMMTEGVEWQDQVLSSRRIGRTAGSGHLKATAERGLIIQASSALTGL